MPLGQSVRRGVQQLPTRKYTLRGSVMPCEHPARLCLTGQPVPLAAPPEDCTAGDDAECLLVVVPGGGLAPGAFESLCRATQVGAPARSTRHARVVPRPGSPLQPVPPFMACVASCIVRLAGWCTRIGRTDGNPQRVLQAFDCCCIYSASLGLARRVVANATLSYSCGKPFPRIPQPSSRPTP